MISFCYISHIFVISSSSESTYLKSGMTLPKIICKPGKMSRFLPKSIICSKIFIQKQKIIRRTQTELYKMHISSKDESLMNAEIHKFGLPKILQKVFVNGGASAT